MQAQDFYLNPVYQQSCPDPFVLKHYDGYWCYSTGRSADGRCFPILHSTDLISWAERGSAMDPLTDDHLAYWAPEVSFWNGKFYLYYSTGDGESRMQIRVAVADLPSGPFVDSGRALSAPGFAIDPHVFNDNDGRRWMFYATDFLEHTYIGTGTVCDRLIDPYSLAGSPLPVTRGRFDWHVFDPQRLEKGGVRWYTIEGPCVLKHKGLYYEMFSAGNWKNTTYGVGYAYSDNIQRNEEWTQVCDGDLIFPVMRTIPQHAIGPGHNSVVRGPDNSQVYCVYHRLDPSQTRREMCVDRLEFVGKQLVVYGPSTSPEHRPTPALTQIPNRIGPGMILEVWVCAGEERSATYGVSVDEQKIQINPTAGRFELVPGTGPALPAGFRTGVHHLIHVETSGQLLRAVLDDSYELKCVLPAAPIGAALFANETSARFDGVSFTRGWTDNFSDDAVSLRELGWTGGLSGWSIGEKQLRKLSAPTGVIYKQLPSSSYECVVNLWLPDIGSAAAYTFFPLATETDDGPRIEIVERANGYRVSFRDMDFVSSLRPNHYEQLRFRVDENIFSMECGSENIYRGPADISAARVGIDATGEASLDMIRVVDLEKHSGDSV
jgi:GH43 family beta-xylosidase